MLRAGDAAAAPHPRADLDRLVVPSNHGTAEILLASTVEAPLRHGSAGLGRTCSLRSTICFLTLTGTYPMPTFASASLTSSTSRNWPRAREGRSRRSMVFDRRPELPIRARHSARRLCLRRRRKNALFPAA